jgi:hypothetical protein
MQRLTCLAASLTLLGCVACGGDISEPPPDPTGEGGAGGDAAATRPDVGPRDFPCAPGEWELPGGGCQAAGVPSDGCGRGFAHDGGQGCVPILPSAACGPGTMALPGETSCRPVAPCGSGAWANIPTDSNSQHVDGAFTGVSDGSATAPWNTVQAGVDAAADGAVVAVAPGTYAENVRIEGKAVRLWGKCPGEVLVTSPSSEPAVYVRNGADGSEVHRLAINGRTGVLVENVDNVLVDEMWIHDLTWIGVYVYAPADGATASASVSDSLIEDVISNGIYSLGSTLDVTDTAVRRVQPTNDVAGRGITARYDNDRSMRGALSVTHCMVEETFAMGIRVSGSTGVITDSYVRDTDPEVESDEFGGGIWFRGNVGAAEPGEGTVRGVVVEDSHSCSLCAFNSNVVVENGTFRDSKSPKAGIAGAGVTALADGDIDMRPQFVVRASLIEDTEDVGTGAVGSDAVFEGVVVRDVLSTIDTIPSAGLGLTIEPQPLTQQRSAATIRGVLVERSASYGILVAGSDATIEGTLVQDIRPNDVSGIIGRGIGVEMEGTTKLTSSASVRNTLVQRVHEVGLSVLGSTADIESVTVRDVRPAEVTSDLTNLGLGIGIIIQLEYITEQPSSARVSWSRVEGTHTAGIAVSGADATIANTLVRDTKPIASGEFGDGVLVASPIFEYVDGSVEIIETVVTVVDTVVESSTRAGLSAFSSELKLESSWFECNLIPINGESLKAFDYLFTDLGGNHCGCGDISETCRALSSNLAPPTL